MYLLIPHDAIAENMSIHRIRGAVCRELSQSFKLEEKAGLNPSYG